MTRAEFLYNDFVKRMAYEPTSCQDSLMRDIAAFLTSDDADIFVVNGYAGTGKTTVISAVISTIESLKMQTVLLAPTGRSAKVLSVMSGRPAYTVHKHIYRQKSVGENGLGRFTLNPKRPVNTLFVVDEVSLIGIDSGSEQNSGGAMFGSGNLLEDLVTYFRSGTGCRMILCGDAAQLPPVGMEVSPALSREYMEGIGGVQFATLTTVVRQASDSGILHNATIIRHMIERGSPSDTFEGFRLETGAFDDISRVGGEDLIETITDAYGRYGEDETVVLCRSNKRAIRYNLGIRSQVQYKEDRLVRGDRLMIVKNCYQFVENVPGMDYIANGDIAYLEKIGSYEERYGLHFAEAVLSFPDYGSARVRAKVCLDTLESESASLTSEQQNALYQGVLSDYAHLTTKKQRYDAVREDKYYNALQLKYAEAVTCHKSQGGQWSCVFVDCPFWQEEQTLDDLKWLYTALTRSVKKVYLVNFKDSFFA